MSGRSWEWLEVMVWKEAGLGGAHGGLGNREESGGTGVEGESGGVPELRQF